MESRFSKQAELYSRYRPDYPHELYEFIFQHLKAYNRAWDCATGSGQVASVLANHFDQVYASDISQEQIRYAPQKPNITYSTVPAEDTGFTPDQFDLITVAQAIHWFDFDKFYNEVKRVAREEALIAVIGYSRITIDSELDDVINPFYDRMFGQYFNNNREYLEDKYRSIPFPFEEIDSPGFERKLTWTLDDLSGYLNSWSATQQYQQDYGVNPVDEFLEKVQPIWNGNLKHTVTFPIFLRLGKVKQGLS